MTARRDVVIVGGGPAGLAAGAVCARDGRRVTLFERGAPEDFRVGETLGAEVGARLRELGGWEAMEPVLGAQAQFLSVRSAWGSSAIEERSTVFHPLGAGWHVDRTRFDLGLLAWARREGVDVRTESGGCSVTRDGDGFLVTPRRGEPVWGRRLLDASGRGAPATASLGEGRWLAHDRQVAILQRFHPAPSADPAPGLILESVEAGFWYASQLADGTLLAVLITDADVLAALGDGRDARFASALARTRHTAERVGGAAPIGPPLTFRSDSGRLIPDRGDGWRALGDAAMSTDPLGGNGVARALKSVADATADLDAPVDPGRAEARFSDYLDQRTEFYWLEDRWPDVPFWSRRRPVDADGVPLDWKRIALTLPPEARVRWRAEAPPPAAEAWLPRAGLAALREAAAHGIPAHAAMRAVAAAAPVGHRRILVALQWLLSASVLSEEG
jgi:flavin-dependent dehydrogenase